MSGNTLQEYTMHLRRSVSASRGLNPSAKRLLKRRLFLESRSIGGCSVNLRKRSLAHFEKHMSNSRMLTQASNQPFALLLCRYSSIADARQAEPASERK